MSFGRNMAHAIFHFQNISRQMGWVVT